MSFGLSIACLSMFATLSAEPSSNNIHVIITNQTESFTIGGVSFLISDCIKNMNLLKGQGIPKINIKNIYDYSELSDIILHFKP